MIDAVEERRQIDIDHGTVFRPEVVTHLPHGLVRVSIRTEPVTLVAELALEPWRELLRDGLAS